MLSGLKFIPRDQLDTAQEEDDLDASRKEKKKSNSRKEKDGRRKKNSKKSSKYSSSEDDFERIRPKSRKKKKWYSSDEDLTTSSSKSESESSSGQDEKKHSNSTKRRRKRKYEDNSEDEGDGGAYQAKDIVRKELGLEWMLRPQDNVEGEPETTCEHQPEETSEETPAKEIKRMNPKELNPYLKDNGSGYPENTDGKKSDGNQLLSSSVVGDGGASWRLKALKRAQEQAAREGRKLDKVVEDRWGSLGQLTVSVASHRAAPSYSHLHAIRNRKMGLTEGKQNHAENQHERLAETNNGHERLERASVRHPKMKVPKLHDSLSWSKCKGHDVSTKDSGIISSAMTSINKFNNDGSFMRDVMNKRSDDSGGSLYTNSEKKLESQLPSEDGAVIKNALSANQLAAKALQLRMRGKHEEAENLLKEVENVKVKVTAAGDVSSRLQNEVSTDRYIMHDISIRQKKKEEDADMHLARKIVKNQQYSIAGRADDEYDFDDGPRRKTRKKGGANERKSTETTRFDKRILTQKERCQFCLENPSRPRHLVVAVANFTYLSLPHWEPIVPGHCCILPMQHESATRTVENNIWDEIRNFKKCLIMMFAKQEKSLVFLETVMGLAQQRRHCLVECVPLPQEIAKQAPLYFKKAIDEAEDEWSQHNAKKLIDTSEKGLRASIPKNFPYFHVEFGLNKGFVHVIDDEQQFKSNFGLNVVRGMLRLPEEDMYRRRKHESAESQKLAVASFARDWEPFDWTKQLD